MREKQIEELAQVIAHSCIDLVESSCGECVSCVSCLATNLYKEGVTIQKWIPVTERLPTIEDATEKGAVLAWEVSVKHWDIWAWDCVRDYPDRFVGWMPLPEAPKGEQ